jgi:hypothetical protein
MIKIVCHGFLSILLLVTTSLGPMEALCGEEDPYFAELEVEGFSPIILSQLPIISNETEIVEVTNEKDMIISKKPGKTRYSNIVCVMDLDRFPEQMQNWRQETMAGIFTKRWGTVTIKDRETGKVKIQYIFYEGWPWKMTYLPTGEKFFVYYEIATTKIEVKKFPLMPE